MERRKKNKKMTDSESEPVRKPENNYCIKKLKPRFFQLFSSSFRQ